MTGQDDRPAVVDRGYVDLLLRAYRAVLYGHADDLRLGPHNRFPLRDGRISTKHSLNEDGLAAIGGRLCRSPALWQPLPALRSYLRTWQTNDCGSDAQRNWTFATFTLLLPEERRALPAAAPQRNTLSNHREGVTRAVATWLPLAAADGSLPRANYPYLGIISEPSDTFAAHYPSNRGDALSRCATEIVGGLLTAGRPLPVAGEVAERLRGIPVSVVAVPGRPTPAQQLARTVHLALKRAAYYRAVDYLDAYWAGLTGRRDRSGWRQLLDTESLRGAAAAMLTAAGRRPRIARKFVQDHLLVPFCWQEAERHWWEPVGDQLAAVSKIPRARREEELESLRLRPPLTLTEGDRHLGGILELALADIVDPLRYPLDARPEADARCAQLFDRALDSALHDVGGPDLLRRARDLAGNRITITQARDAIVRKPRPTTINGPEAAEPRSAAAREPSGGTLNMLNAAAYHQTVNPDSAADCIPDPDAAHDGYLALKWLPLEHRRRVGPGYLQALMLRAVTGSAAELPLLAEATQATAFVVVDATPADAPAAATQWVDRASQFLAQVDPMTAGPGALAMTLRTLSLFRSKQHRFHDALALMLQAGGLVFDTDLAPSDRTPSLLDAQQQVHLGVAGLYIRVVEEMLIVKPRNARQAVDTLGRAAEIGLGYAVDAYRALVDHVHPEARPDVKTPDRPAVPAWAVNTRLMLVRALLLSATATVARLAAGGKTSRQRLEREAADTDPLVGGIAVVLHELPFHALTPPQFCELTRIALLYCFLRQGARLDFDPTLPLPAHLGTPTLIGPGYIQACSDYLNSQGHDGGILPCVENPAAVHALEIRSGGLYRAWAATTTVRCRRITRPPPDLQ